MTPAERIARPATMGRGTAGPAWPMVSVLISTKDRRADLARALASLRAQEYPRERVQMVVVEETDAPAPPPDVLYVPIPREGRGFGYTRAVALRHARGDIVAFTDDDCVVTPSWLRELVTPFLDDPAVLGVAGAVRVKDANTVGICENVLGFPGGGLSYLTRAGGRVVDTVHLSTCNCAYRTEVLGAVGGFPEVAPFSGEDYLVGRRVSRLGRCVYAPRAVVFHKPRGTLGAVLRWFVRRGRQEVWLLRHHPDVFELGACDLIRTSLVVRVTGALALGGLLGIPTLATLGALLLAYGVAQNVRYRFAWRYHRTAWLPVVLPATKLAMGVGGEVGRWIEALGWAREVGSKRRPVGARR
ncbi:MAG: glycosyltransferase [Candidatus Rokubacteria bacterium]|nr:glycosyltransferase [Candidatus Rokubacteria bacterium]